MPVDPGPEDVKRYVEEDDGGPVVMLNMLKYKADGGRESYGEYGAKVMAFLEAVGGEILSSSASPWIQQTHAFQQRNAFRMFLEFSLS